MIQCYTACRGDRIVVVQVLVPVAVAEKPRPYRIRVTTSDTRGAGTDANVFINLFGRQGTTSRRRLETSANNFERGRTDEFCIKAADLGDVERVEIGHDGGPLV